MLSACEIRVVPRSVKLRPYGGEGLFLFPFLQSFLYFHIGGMLCINIMD